MPHVLPRRYQFAHRYSIFLHDLIVAKARSAIENGVFKVRFDVEPGDHETMPESGEGLYDWIEKTRGRDVTMEMDYKLVMQALLLDFCNFVLEGLRASAKGKLTVAYVLTRKPFKDNLFYLEWLLADSAEFLTRLRNAPESVLVAGLGTPFVRGVIAAAVAKTDEPGQNVEFLDRLRYDRNAAFGLASSWDKAAHLVTTRGAVRTETHNLNFIFSGADEWESQWSRLYESIPLLLHHAVVVIDALFEKIATVPEDYIRVKRLRRQLGIVEWRRSLKDENAAGQMVGAADLVAPLEGDALRCPNCHAPVRLHTRNVRAFILRGTVRCSSCRTTSVADLTEYQDE